MILLSLLSLNISVVMSHYCPTTATTHPATACSNLPLPNHTQPQHHAWPRRPSTCHCRAPSLAVPPPRFDPQPCSAPPSLSIPTPCCWLPLRSLIHAHFPTQVSIRSPILPSCTCEVVVAREQASQREREITRNGQYIIYTPDPSPPVKVAPSCFCFNGMFFFNYRVIKWN